MGDVTLKGLADLFERLAAVTAERDALVRLGAKLAEIRTLARELIEAGKRRPGAINRGRAIAGRRIKGILEGTK